MKTPLVLCTVLLCLSSNSVMPHPTVKNETNSFAHDKKVVANEQQSPSLVPFMLPGESRFSPMTPAALTNFDQTGAQGGNHSSSSSSPFMDQENSDSDIDGQELLGRSMTHLPLPQHQGNSGSGLSVGLNATPSAACLVALMEQRKQVFNAPHNATPPSPMKKVNGIRPHAQPGQDHHSTTPSPKGTKRALVQEEVTTFLFVQPAQDHVPTTPSPFRKKQAHVPTTPSPIRKPSSPDKK
jgi:hypothetical protein